MFKKTKRKNFVDSFHTLTENEIGEEGAYSTIIAYWIAYGELEEYE